MITDPKRDRENIWCEYLAENLADLDALEQIELSPAAEDLRRVKPKPE